MYVVWCGGCRCVGTYIRVCSVVGVSLKGACMYGLIGVKVGGGRDNFIVASV